MIIPRPMRNAVTKKHCLGHSECSSLHVSSCHTVHDGETSRLTASGTEHQRLVGPGLKVVVSTLDHADSAPLSTYKCTPQLLRSL